MPKYKETSDYHNSTGYGDEPSRRVTVRIGFGRVWAPGTERHNAATGFRICGEKEKDETNMVSAMLPRHEWYPLDPMDIVMPAPLWPIDKDGRGWSVLEMDQWNRQHPAATGAASVAA